jgi:hypothetical protein
MIKKNVLFLMDTNKNDFSLVKTTYQLNRQELHQQTDKKNSEYIMFDVFSY